MCRFFEREVNLGCKILNRVHLDLNDVALVKLYFIFHRMLEMLNSLFTFDPNCHFRFAVLRKSQLTTIEQSCPS